MVFRSVNARILLGSVTVLCSVYAAISPQMSQAASFGTRTGNDTGGAGVKLQLNSTGTAANGLSPRNDLSLALTLVDSSSNPIIMLQGCGIAPRVTIVPSDGGDDRVLPSADSADTTDPNSCIPDQITVPAHGSRALQYSYLVSGDTQGPHSIHMAVPAGQYSVQASLVYRVETGDLAHRYIRQADGHLVDTFPIEHVTSDLLPWSFGSGPQSTAGTRQAATGTQLLTNGGFEGGASSWSTGNASTTIGPSVAHSGSASAQLCGTNGCSAQLWQTVSLPSGATSLSFSYWYDVSTQQRTRQCTDYLNSQIRLANGTLLRGVQSICNSVRSGWIQETVDLSSLLTSYGGQQIEVFFQATTNATGPTTFFIDDVSLIASGGSGTGGGSIPPPPGTCVGDTFTASSLDPRWQYISPAGDGSYSLTARAGMLRIQAPGPTDDLTPGDVNAPRVVTSLAGNFDARTQVSGTPRGTFSAMGLVVWFNQFNYVWIGKGSDGAIDQRSVQYGVLSQPRGLGTSATSLFLRGVWNGTSVTTYYSLNGSTWSLAGSFPYPHAPASASVGMFVLNTSSTSFYADFNSFTDTQPCGVTPPALAYPQDSTPSPFSPKVLVIDYNTSGQPDDGTQALTNEYITAFQTGSKFRGSGPSSGNFQIGGTVEVAGPPPLINGATTHGAQNADYMSVFQQYNICGLAASEGVNFVWIWAAGTEAGGPFYAGDFMEWVTTGPTFNETYGRTVPTCAGHTVTVMGLNYSRSVALAVHSFGHYMENVLQYAFGPAYAAGPGGTDMYDQWDGQVSRYSGYSGPLNTTTAECGDVHYPPNTVSAYSYAELVSVQSDCATYNPGNLAAEQYVPVNATTWEAIPCDPGSPSRDGDCAEYSYHLWWMQNMPGYNNGLADLTGNAMPNWWQYVVDLDSTVRYN